MAECLTLFLAGHETTATALTWTWYLLCQHGESYQKVRRKLTASCRVARLPMPTWHVCPTASRPSRRRCDSTPLPISWPGRLYAMSRLMAIASLKAGSSCFLRTRCIVERTVSQNRSNLIQSASPLNGKNSFPLRVPAFWRRSAHLPRLVLRSDGGPSVTCDARPAHQFCLRSWPDDRTRSRPSRDIAACRVDQCHGEEEGNPRVGHTSSREHET